MTLLIQHNIIRRSGKNGEWFAWKDAEWLIDEKKRLEKENAALKDELEQKANDAGYETPFEYLKAQHEEAAGMPLEDSFFNGLAHKRSGKQIDAPFNVPRKCLAPAMLSARICTTGTSNAR